MPHPLVTQLWFARSELQRCLAGISAEDAARRVEPMNCISWTIGHLAAQEQYLWLELAQGKIIVPDLEQRVGYGSPGCKPSLDEMWSTWETITQAADTYLTTITDEMLGVDIERDGEPSRDDIGTMLLRNIYHYWFHLGEAHAVRQMLGHPDLPQFVGNMAQVHHSAAD
jgi:hypothetical protein